MRYSDDRFRELETKLEMVMATWGLLKKPETPSAAKEWCQLRSYISTARKNGLGVLDSIF